MNLSTKSNQELVDILGGSEDEILLNKAGEALAANNPTNDQLFNTLRYCTDKSIIAKAGAKLRENVGISVPVDESSLIKQIAHEVLSRPGSLKMDQWHCGTAHCIGGHACLVNPIAADIEKRFNTQTAAAAVLPNHVSLFFEDDDKALSYLTAINNGAPILGTN